MKYDVFGIGNILVDLLVKVEDKELNEFQLKKGLFHLIEGEKLRGILQKLSNKDIKLSPAGSCANTIFGIAGLGGNAVLCGKVGKDEHGDFYETKIGKNIKGNLARCHVNPTGKVVCLITPDSERTFAVDLGAAINLKKEEIVEEDLKNSKILHLTGYEIEAMKETCLHAIEIAKQNNVMISIDLADPGVIERNLEDLKEIVAKHADIIFLNEEEAMNFTGKEAEEAVMDLGDSADIVIIKLGKKGSLINDNGAVIFIEGVKANAVDTTGAGDMYAAGILYGLSHDYELEKAGKLASRIAAKIVEQIGAHPEFDLREFVEE